MKNIVNFFETVIMIFQVIGFLIASSIKYYWDKLHLAKPLMVIGVVNAMTIAFLSAFYLLALLKGEMTDGAHLASLYFTNAIYLSPFIILSILTLTVWRKQISEYTLEIGNYLFHNESYS